MRRLPILAVATAVSFVSACSGADKAPVADSVAAVPVAAPAVVAIGIASPAEGDSVMQPFTIRHRGDGRGSGARDGTAEPGKGHHHLIIDGDVPSDSLPLPAAPIVIHMGDASTERNIEGLKPGPHRIIAVFADGAHVPMASVKRDTLNITVIK